MCDMDDEYEFTGTSSRIVRQGRPKFIPKVVRWSPAYFRVVGAGFTIGDIEPPITGVTFFDNRGNKMKGFTHVCLFACVCGRSEWAILTLPWDAREVDVARMMEDAGNISPRHLLDDGYTIADIRSIRRAYV